MTKKESRKFNGVQFAYLGRYFYKTQADDRAKRERSRGHKIRIVKGSGHNPRFGTIKSGVTYRLFIKRRRYKKGQL